MKTGQETDNANSAADYLESVKQVLDHLFDFPYLQRHPLTEQIPPEGAPGETGAQRLRRIILAAIESLSPGTGVEFRAPAFRPYNLLHLRYVEGRTVQEAAHDLGISIRQAHRDLRRGEESVASLLHSRLLPAPAARIPSEVSAADSEVDRLEMRPVASNLTAILEKALASVRPLSLQRHITLHSRLPEGPLPVSTDPSIAQQAVTSLFSRAIQHASAGALEIRLDSRADSAIITLRLEESGASWNRPFTDFDIAVKLAARLGWEVRLSAAAEDREIRLQIPNRLPLLLVIDDNQGLVDLVSRLMAGSACRVISANSGDDGLRLAEQVRPDAILLDVMMPGRDGWEVLQILRNRPSTASMPVIVCSALNDPELAYSLGASRFLPKQVGRESLLDALRQLNVV